MYIGIHDKMVKLNFCPHGTLMFFLLLWCCEIRIRMCETNTSVVTWVMP